MLVVAACELGHPVLLSVLMKADDPLVHSMLGCLALDSVRDRDDDWKHQFGNQVAQPYDRGLGQAQLADGHGAALRPNREGRPKADASGASGVIVDSLEAAQCISGAAARRRAVRANARLGSTQSLNDLDTGGR